MQAYCPNFSLLCHKQEGAFKVVVVRLRCKQWSCDFCAARNREMWRSHLKKRIGKLGGRWWFITLTAPEWNRTAASTLAALRSGIDRLMKRIRRVFGKVEYVRVYEAHKTGCFHAHLVMSGLSSRVRYGRARSGLITFEPTDRRGACVWSVNTWLSRQARACKMGYRVDVQEVQGVQKVVNYVCKYITKESQGFNEKGLRRIQTSQGIGSCNPRGAGKGWTVSQHVWASDMPVQAQLYDSTLKLTINPSYWLTNTVYPPEA